MISENEANKDPFEFEKLAIFYLIFYSEKFNVNKKLLKILIQEKTESGDIDAALLFEPNLTIRIQIKANEKRENVLLNKMKKGIKQLWDFYITDKQQDVHENEYILLHEGDSTEKYVREFYKKNRKYTYLDKYVNFILKKDDFGNGKEGGQAFKEQAGEFVDRFRVILTPEKDHMKHDLLNIYSEEEFNLIYGNLGSKQKITNPNILSKMQKEHRHNKVELPAFDNKRYKKESRENPKNNLYKNVCKKLFKLYKEKKRAREQTKSIMENAFRGGDYMNRFEQENGILYEKLIDLKGYYQNLLNVTSKGIFKDKNEYTFFFEEYIQKIKKILPDPYTERDILYLVAYPIEQWLDKCDIDFE